MSIVRSLPGWKQNLKCCDHGKDTRFEVVGFINCQTNHCELESSPDADVEITVWNKRDYEVWVTLELSSSTGDSVLKNPRRECKVIGARTTQNFYFSVKNGTGNSGHPEYILVDFRYEYRKRKCEKGDVRSPNFTVKPEVEFC